MITEHLSTAVCRLGLAVFLCLSAAWQPALGASPMKPEEFFSAAQVGAYRAAQQGDVEALRAAAASGAVSLNAPGKEDMTLLALAVLNADRKAIASLVRAGADPNQTVPEAGSPAVMAISKHFNPPSTEALQGLLDAGYDVNQRIRSQPYLFYFVRFNHWPGMKLALEKGGDINARNSGGKSLLTYVIENGDYAIARALIELGADVSVKGARGETALEAVEWKLRQGDASRTQRWTELVNLRRLLLERIPSDQERRTRYSDEVNRKIQGGR